MFQFFLNPARQILDRALEKLDKSFKKWFTPAAKTNLSVGTITDLTRSKSSFVAENALKRQMRMQFVSV